MCYIYDAWFIITHPVEPGANGMTQTTFERKYMAKGQQSVTP